MTGRRKVGCLGWIGLVLVGLFGFSILVGLVLSGGQPAGNDSANATSNDQLYLAEATIDVKSLKQSLRDPDSLLLETVGASTKKHLVCIVYRARNGFGGMNRDAVAFTDAGAMTSPARVRRLCHGRGFSDITHFFSTEIES